MPCVGFELTIPAFERTKTVHAVDRAPAYTKPIIPYMVSATIKEFLYSIEII
jgi:hypothetical protein